MLLSNLMTSVTFAMSSKHRPKNLIAGTWNLTSASSTNTITSTTSLPYGSSPAGILIFSPTFHFCEFLSVDPSTLSRFASSTDRTSGTSEQNAIVVAGTLGQDGTYTVDGNGEFESNIILASSFPNFIGIARDTSTLSLTLSEDGSRLYEKLQDIGSDFRIELEYARMN